MEKLIQIVWLLSWPVLIFFTYHVVRIFSARYEKRVESEKQNNQ